MGSPIANPKRQACPKLSCSKNKKNELKSRTMQEIDEINDEPSDEILHKNNLWGLQYSPSAYRHVRVWKHPLVMEPWFHLK